MIENNRSVILKELRIILQKLFIFTLLPGMTLFSCIKDTKPSMEEMLPGLLPLLARAGSFMDVHGAGAQRSDPKMGDADAFPVWGAGPQGDVRRVDNYARCVRGSTGTVADGQSYSVVDTNQTVCYDDGTSGVITCPSEGEDYYGQDGNYTSSSPVATLTASYTTTTHSNGDVVTDNNTGLMWTKSYYKVEWADKETAVALAGDGGYSDWRIPTIKEIYSLMQFDGKTGSADPTSSTVPADADPYIDQSVFDFEYPAAPARFIDAQYLTTSVYTSTVMNGQECFFGLNVADGRIKCYPFSGNVSNSTYYVRYVRNAVGSGYGTNSFTDNGDNTISDTATGLTWPKYDSGSSIFSSDVSSFTNTDGSMNFKEALSFCENLSYAGQSDWRLPDAKELHTIVDYSRSLDATDSPAIDPIFDVTGIVNEMGANDYPFFWSSTTHLDGPVDGENAVYISFGEALGYF